MSRHRRQGEPLDEHERTVAIGAQAIEQIKALRLPATPRQYEVWYAYATGDYPSLTETLNQLLARSAMTAETAVEQIGNQFVSPSDIKERIDSIGTRMANAIGRVLSALDVTILLAGNSSRDVAHVGETLPGASDSDPVQAGIEKMALATNKMRLDRQRLETELDASTNELDRLRQQLQIIRAMSVTDPITGLVNRKQFDQSLRKALSNAVERSEPLTVMLGDIDHFKGFNDTWGHPTGDQVLRLVASEVKRGLSKRDTIARFGGDEFAAILPDTTLSTACLMVDDLRRAIMSRNIISRSTGQNLGRVTVSFGIALAHRSDTTATLVARADDCLYRAKNRGRNRVMGENDPDAGENGTQTAAA
jgi:diguanylate cyclase